MSYLAFLDREENRAARGSWLSVAASLGHPVQLFGGAYSPQALDRFLAEADGFLIFESTFILDEQVSQKIHTAIAHGKRALVRCDLGELSVYNAFLDPYGIEATTLKAFLRDPVTDHPRIFPISRRDAPESFCYPPLLEGVEDLLLHQPNVLRHDDRAIPLLALPLDKAQIVELASDYFATWERSLVPVACLCDPEFRVQGGVVAFATDNFHDPYTGPTGVSWPGIAGAHNRRFLENLLAWVSRDLLSPASFAAEAFEVIYKIEGTLSRFIKRVLSANRGTSWWESSVPPHVRAQAEKRRDKEHRYLPAASYLGLPDLRAILEANWLVFEGPVARIGWRSRSSLAWFDKLLDIRNRTMHPLKEQLAGTVVSADELAFLRGLCDKISNLQLSTNGAA